MPLNNPGSFAIEGWQTLTKINSWNRFSSSYPDARFFVDPFGIVHLGGIISGGTNGSIGTLPAKARAAYSMIFPVAAMNSSGVLIICRVEISTTGLIQASAFGLGFLSFDGITYRLSN